VWQGAGGIHIIIRVARILYYYIYTVRVCARVPFEYEPSVNENCLGLTLVKKLVARQVLTINNRVSETAY